MYRRYYNPYNGYPKQTQNLETTQAVDTIKQTDNTPKIEANHISDTYKDPKNNKDVYSTIPNGPEIIVPEKLAEDASPRSITSFLSTGLGFLDRLKRDDIILIALILLFLLDGAEDEGILIILLALFIMGL